MLQLRPEAAVEARRMLERVIEIDPGLVLAYARLSIITFADYANLWNGATPENLERALELARKAIKTDDTEPQGHIALALVLAWMRRLDEADRAAEHAVALDPNSADSATSWISRVGTKTPRHFSGRLTGSTRNSTWLCTSSAGPCSPLAALWG
jgi:adenylate cyclase